MEKNAQSDFARCSYILTSVIPIQNHELLSVELMVYVGSLAMINRAENYLSS